tara:strand:- start:1771 stop:2619 length:849 start_codon:yes stop_codon:yes gene_type:complete
MLNFNAKLFLTVFISSLLLTSCGRNQDEDVELDIDTEVALVEVQVDKTISSIDDIADQAELGTSITKKTTSENDILTNCATVTKDTLFGNTRDTIIIKVDFGTVPCEGDDGSFRKGEILITSIVDNFNGFRDARKIETSNYIVDGNIISIVRKLDYDGIDQQNNHKWKLSMDGRIDFTDGRYIERSVDQIRTWTMGISTPTDWTDDEFTIQGNSTGKRIDGKNITSTIVNTLKLRTSCAYIVSGKIKIETASRPDLDVDYGNGTCDNKATATSQGQTWIITL